MNIGTEEEARALVIAFSGTGQIMSAMSESSCLEDMDRARNFEPILLRRTDCSWIFGTDDFTERNDYIAVNGEGISARIYLEHLDLHRKSGHDNTTRLPTSNWV